MKTIKLIACACALFASSAAMAEVTFNPATGIGFVGKGDVQSAFGWNNAMLQANAGSLTFTYVALDKYSAVCTFTTPGGKKEDKIHNVGHKRNVGVSGAVAFKPRVMNQITGFNLTGISSGVVTGGDKVPVLNGPCPGNPGHDGIWTSVSLISSTTSLTVSHSGTAVQIWPAL